jgi:transcriptional regulator with XRE-family HTH domain
MNETLKQIRINALNFSEEDMATKLNMSVAEYINLERQQISIGTLERVSKAVGKSIDELVNKRKEKIKFEIGDAWNSVEEFKKSISDFLGPKNRVIQDSNNEQMKRDIVSLLNTVEKMSRKPRVAFVGKSDVGKSTLINSLIGSKIIPEAWTPTTSIVIHVKHLCDKPKYCDKDVMIFRPDENQNLWDDTRLADEKYTKSFCIASGSYSLLQDFGSRQGSQFEQTDAVSAVVFVDSVILKNCDLLDLPGYGTKDREDDDSLLKRIKNIDILVYMSLANGFMRGDDITWLQNELPNLSPITLNNEKMKPLANLFVVASQAHIVSNGSLDDLNTILDKGVERFEKTLSTNYWANFGQNVTHKSFRNRFFVYSTDQESLRTDFESDLRNLLEFLPQIIINKIANFIKENAQLAINQINRNLLSLNKILSQREKIKEKIRKLEQDEPERISNNENKKILIFQKIEDFCQKAKIDFTAQYNKIINKDAIINLIKDNEWGRTEEDMKSLSSKLSNLLNDSYSNIAKNYSEKLEVEIDEYIQDFANSTRLHTINNNIEVGTSFNFKASFAGGLAGVGAYGALALWASSLGNLGAYILIAKGVSLLSAIGISIGGTATAISAISAIGGPVVLMFGIVALVGFSAYYMFSWRWIKGVSKKIVTLYDKKRVLAEYNKNIELFWNNTRTAFTSAADNLEKEYEEYLGKLKSEILETSDEDIKQKIDFEEETKEIYHNLISEL